MNNKIEKNFLELASLIWVNGETYIKGQGGLNPNCFGGNDDPIIDEYDVTHFDLVWEVKGESVKLTFYRAEAFGACEIDSEPIFEKIINVKGI